MTIRAIVDYEVMFDLTDEDTFVLPGRRLRSWVRVDTIHVRLRADRVPRVMAFGIRCRKNGEPDARMGRRLESVDLDTNDPWVERARMWAEQSAADR